MFLFVSDGGVVPPAPPGDKLPDVELGKPIEKSTAQTVETETDDDVTKGQLFPLKNLSLERESKGIFSLILFSSIFIFLDLFKQIACYGVKYYNKDKYPIPQTYIVLATEIFKCSVVLAIIVYKGEIRSLRVSFAYAIPAFIGAINNNIYYLALNYTSPPIWNILSQLRIIFTGLAYRFVFKRDITRTQWTALFILILSIAATKLSSGGKSGVNFVHPMAFVLAVIGSLLSVCAMVYIEVCILVTGWPFFSIFNFP